jgi:hypothetical protein
MRSSCRSSHPAWRRRQLYSSEVGGCGKRALLSRSNLQAWPRVGNLSRSDLVLAGGLAQDVLMHTICTPLALAQGEKGTINPQ